MSYDPNDPYGPGKKPDKGHVPAVNAGADASGLGAGGKLPGAMGDAAEGAWGAAKDAIGGLGLGGGLMNDFNASYLQPGEGSYNLEGSRGLQGAGIDPLRQWALTGQGPSAAQAMLKNAQAQNIAAGMSMAKSMPGATPGAQQYMASQSTAQAMGGTAAEMAALRAKEQQGAMQMYQQALEAYRRGDIDTYKAAAQAYADAERANAQVAAENAAARRGIIGGIVEGGAGIIGGLL